MSVRILESTLQIFNPATGEDISSLSMTSISELQTILKNAKNEAEWYNCSNFFQRQKLIKNFQKGIVQHMDNFVQTISSETGKKDVESLMEVFISLEHLQKSSWHLHEALGKRNRRVGILKTKKAWVEYDAMGVAGIISPWNYPLILTLSPMVEALLAGNTVILKPSEHTPLTTKLLKRVWDQSTEMPKLFQVVYGAGEIGNELVKSSYTDIICFTGSTAVGREIAIACASLFKPVILELGGKDPMIILDDANIDRSVEAALWGGLSNAGQTCISIERIYAHKTIYPQVVERLSDRIRKMSSGKNSMHLGAISIEQSMKKINKQVSDARETSHVIEGSSENGWFIPPTLVINPPSSADIHQDETFGPVMTIEPFQSDKEAIELANKTGYGLSASVFGKNRKRMQIIAKQIKVGTVSFNDVLTHYGIADLPFGGMGLSGMGKVHGKEGLRAFSHQKGYMRNRLQIQSEFWWYKKRSKFGKFLRKWIQWQYS